MTGCRNVTLSVCHPFSNPASVPVRNLCRTARNFGFVLIAVLFALCTLPLQGAAQDAAQPLLRTTALEIRTVTGTHRFVVEMALADEERSVGLMHRREMADEAGMLFDFGRDDVVLMWMKNTILSLDMVFIKADGTVANVAERTTPFSLDTIASRGPVRAVLEVSAGTAKRIGLKAGDRVRNVIFGNL